MERLRYLLIDDMREPGTCGIPKEAVVCRTPSEGIYALETNRWDVLYLDHDMGFFQEGKEITGMDVLNWLEEHPEHRPFKIRLTTSNAAVYQKMAKIVNKMEQGVYE